MSDPRLERLARLITGYSLDLQPGEVVRLEGSEAGESLLLELYRAALRLGANPYLDLSIDRLAELMVAEGSDEQLAHVARLEWDELEVLDAAVTVWGETNTRAFTNADPDRHGRRLAARQSLIRRTWERIAAAEMRWCGTLAPANAFAQDAEMSLADYEDFVFGACHVDGEDDPVEYWRAVSSELGAQAERLTGVSELRILGPDTDLRLGVGGRGWEVADGRVNMPDGEIFTSPVEDATEGEIRFTFPALYAGREVTDVRLRFEGGRVVASEAARGGEFLESLLDRDAGSRILGEAAFGLNYGIDRFTGNILFDEKIGGTVHVALGSSFPEVGGRNDSSLHWDLICDLRADGEVHADGELVWKAGRFLDG